MARSIIITSTKDVASMNIRNKLLELTNWVETNFTIDGHVVLENKDKTAFLVLIENDLIYSDYLKDKLNQIDADRLIFASRHASQTKKPSLHVHYTGNWSDDNRYGGKPRSLSIAEPIAAKEAFLGLYSGKDSLELNTFDVSLEVTHHGPTELELPLFFIELGSGEEQWCLKDAAELLAKVILEIASVPISNSRNIAIGFGGPHYAPSFTREILSNDIYISHIIPKYFVDLLDQSMLEKMIEQTSVKPNIALIDWKGLKGSQRKKVLGLIEEKNLEIIKI